MNEKIYLFKFIILNFNITWSKFKTSTKNMLRENCLKRYFNSSVIINFNDFDLLKNLSFVS